MRNVFSLKKGYSLDGSQHAFCSMKCSSRSNAAKTKRINTCLERYSVTHVMKTPFVQSKVKATVVKKYGCENVFQAESIKQKIGNTKEALHGDRHWINAEKKGQNELAKIWLQECVWMQRNQREDKKNKSRTI